jgi:hypothetical protein
VGPTPERPLSPRVISTVPHSAAAVWRIMNEQLPDRAAVDQGW